MAYSTISKPSLHFNTKLYTGNGSVRTETGIGFQPDLVWIKDRTGTNNHELNDAVRGANYQIYANLTNAQTNAGGHLTAFASDGFTLGTDGAINTNNSNYVSWNWKANGAGSSNTDGSITSTVSVNTTAGFSIVKYTGNDTTGATVGHGLGEVPKMIIVKRYTDVRNWPVYHHSIGNTNKLYLNLTDASASSTNWNNTTPSSSVFTISNASDVNGGGGSSNYVAYCFTDKTGYSKFGSYVSNGVSGNGSFVYTGFKPAFVIHKRTDAAGDWRSWNNKSDVFNQNDRSIFPNTNSAEYDTTAVGVDFLSNGIKWRQTDTANNNPSGGTFIFMAFAEEPLVANSGTSGVPATAK